MITQSNAWKPSPEAGAPFAQPVAPERPGRRSRRRTGFLVFGGGALVATALAAALTAGTLPRWRQEQKVDAAAAETASAPPRVTVAVARQSASDAERVLPGNIQPLLDASIYARTTGYLKERLVDIGDRVKEGQLLGVIAAPDIDDQLAQAKANLVQAKASLVLAQANAQYAKITLDRDYAAGGPATVAQQQIDLDAATVKTTAAQVEAARAMIQVNEAAV